ncbi:serine--pyruvate aminotransferase-like [Orbicella faveolata]|uniref:serine--pyruvate aminotransferase-like n=1 Tax=Orbicella faveolata TaxID=48498 RepID=UPI0009E5C57B|nr:serine--pyruvate aminotransferase-like [Orbicella faveolata]
MSLTKFARLFGVAARGPLRFELRALSTATAKLAEEWKPKVPPPEELLVPLTVPTKLLFGPGPSNPSMRIYNASAMSLLGHLQADFHHIMDETKAGLKYVFQTNNDYTLAITGAGHAAMEASIMNLVERGERILVCVNGMWGSRAREIAERQGCDVRVLEKSPGEYYTRDEIEQGLKEHKPSVLFIVHSESSSGICQPMDDLGALCHKHNCLIIVDTVASLGGTPFLTDDWDLDCVYSGSQKCLGSPPGIAPITFSPRAMAKINSRRTKVPSFYLDMIELGNYWGCDEDPRRYHHTAAINLVYALRESLALLAEEGLENSWKRHHDTIEHLWAGLEKMGLEMFVKDKAHRLPTVTSVKIPEGFPDWKAVPEYLMKKYKLEIVGGMGPTVGKVWRVGFMGHNSYTENVDTFLRLFKEAIEDVQRRS